MDISDVITRLKEECPAFRSRVFGSAELASSPLNSLQTPCAFVISMAEKAEQSNFMSGFSQRITAQIGVVICVKNVRDARGENGQIELEAVRQEVRKALCNWQAASTDLPFDYLAGQLADYDNFVLRWNDVFTTQFYYRDIS